MIHIGGFNREDEKKIREDEKGIRVVSPTPQK